MLGHLKRDYGRFLPYPSKFITKRYIIRRKLTQETIQKEGSIHRCLDWPLTRRLVLLHATILRLT